MDHEEHIKLTKKEQRKLIELGFYAMAQLVRENFERQIFKREQGIS